MFEIILVSIVQTIDLNLSELEYLANHLTMMECRRLTAAIHFDTFDLPNPLDQAERKVPKDVNCLDLLLYWNGAEGRGKTHEVIEHRLRQMGKRNLADWLGRTVFHELGNDLEESLQEGLRDIIDNTTKKSLDLPMPPLEATAPTYDITEWSAFDTICLAIVTLTILTISALFIKIFVELIARKVKKRRNRKYKQLETDSESEHTVFETPF